MKKFEPKYIYSDGTSSYRLPCEPNIGDQVILKVRVKANSTTAVNLHYNGRVVPMVKGATEGIFDFFYAEVCASDEIILYYFEVAQHRRRLFYSREGTGVKRPPSSVCFKLIPGYKVPQWMKGAVLYQIFVDRFYNGDPANDVVTHEYMYDNWPCVKVEDWYKYPDGGMKYTKGSNRTREFYGGDLQGVIEKLDYLADLGVEGIYFNPLFVSPSNHKYDTQDYENIDPHIGVIVNDAEGLIIPQEDPNYENGDTGNASVVNRGGKKIYQAGDRS